MLGIRDFVWIVLAALILSTAALQPAQAQQLSTSLAQNETDEASATPPNTSGVNPDTGQSAVPFNPDAFKAQAEFMILLSVITAGLLVFTLTILVVIGWKSGLTGEFTRTLILVVIVFAALYLISAGYSNEQAAPVYGLLGTIAGYLFGRAKDEPVRTGDGSRQGTITPGPGEGS